MSSSVESFRVFFGLPPYVMVPLAVSPVANYVAPDPASNWAALGINGCVRQYNDALARINREIQNGHDCQDLLANQNLKPEERAVYEFTMRWIIENGTAAVDGYNDSIDATREQLTAACAHLNVPLPTHGGTPGMKHVYCQGGQETSPG